MRNKPLIVPLALVITAGLSACGANGDQGAQDDGRAHPLAYYSNRDSENGNARTLDNREGPLTEIYDYSYGDEGREINNQRQTRLQTRDENGNPPNPSVPLADHDHNFFQRDNRFSHGDANYHGHLDDNTSQPRSSYYYAYEGDLSEKIADTTGLVRNVEDVRSVIYGSNVLIAVDLTDYSREQETKRDIQKAVRPYLRGRSCTVVTDEGTFSRIRNLDNDLRDGGPHEQINLDMKDLFRTLKERANNRISQ